MANDQEAKYQIGDKLHFIPSADRAPHGTVISEGDVIVTNVVDHGSATAYSPRFTYVVEALATGRRQGTDERELSELTFSEQEATDEALLMLTRRLRRTQPEVYVEIMQSLSEGVRWALAMAENRADRVRAADKKLGIAIGSRRFPMPVEEDDLEESIS